MRTTNNKSAVTTPKPPSERGKFPARLHVLLARDAKVGLVIRRGPSKSVCTVLWNRDRDTFKLGQWLRGRIYERRSDLSPDGKHFIYFAMNGRWDSEVKGSWTAISRVPYLKALNLYPKGDCWFGGGMFRSNKTFWLGHGLGDAELKNTAPLRRDLRPPQYFDGHWAGLYFNRLLRDDWRFCGKEHTDAPLFVKILPKGWLLRKIVYAENGAPPGRVCDWDAHELRHEPTDTVLAFPEWEWADYVDDRLVWASEGQLRSARLGKGKLVGEKILHDFNTMKFEAIAAPY